MTAHLGSVQTEHFLYDAAANLLTRPHTEAPHNQVQGSNKFDYRYAILGRRIEKRSWKASAIANTMTYHQHEPDKVYKRR
ncbi:hypothetical protein [Proteus mirabilis]|uniref:hypothetical protein n=1 Tax=Proteus mirabilis TaxID=584 RepID=UPI002282CE5C|nr:hypothetical protein [Proteus mirabilis]